MSGRLYNKVPSYKRFRDKSTGIGMIEHTISLPKSYMNGLVPTMQFAMMPTDI